MYECPTFIQVINRNIQIMRKYIVYSFSIALLLFLLLPELQGQDASFSQNYASPLYLSPSFTGLTDGSRVSVAYRDQWPSIPNTYKTIAVSFDHYFSSFNSGLGFLYYRDDQGGGLLVDQNLGLLYAYEIYVSDKLMVRPGLQFKFAQTFIDASKATLGTSYDNDGNLVSSGGLDVSDDQTNQFDAAASVMIYSSTYWGGVTVDHLVKSDIGYTDIETNREMKITAFAGYKWVYKNGTRGMADQSITFAVDYRSQGDFAQLDLGAYWQYNPIELGLWYRGLPVDNKEGYSNFDAIIAIIGVNVGKTRIGYSYDLSLSDLAGSTGGAHELSVLYTIPSSNKPRINRNAIPCSQPGYFGSGATGNKYHSRSRKIF